MTWSKKSFVGLGWNCIGLLTIIAWTGATCFIMFYTLKRFRMLRVASNHEFQGKK